MNPFRSGCRNRSTDLRQRPRTGETKPRSGFATNGPLVCGYWHRASPEKRPIRALWCEHHEDYLLELPAGRYIAVQVKTDSRENARWRWSDDALVDSVARFCAFERIHGAVIDGYEFISNAAPYVPAATTKRVDSLAASPDRLIQCCSRASTHAEVEQPYKAAFTELVGKTGGDATVLFQALRKLRFAQGPVLRGYDDTLAASIVPGLPGCAGLLTFS